VTCWGHFIKHGSHFKVNNAAALNVEACSALEEKEEHYKWIYTIRIKNTCNSDHQSLPVSVIQKTCRNTFWFFTSCYALFYEKKQ
jgi:hypothetical protein